MQPGPESDLTSFDFKNFTSIDHMTIFAQISPGWKLPSRTNSAHVNAGLISSHQSRQAPLFGLAQVIERGLKNGNVLHIPKSFLLLNSFIAFATFFKIFIAS